MKKVLTCVILSIFFFIFPNFVEQANAATLTLKEENFNMINFRNSSDAEIIAAKQKGFVTLRNYAKELMQRYPDKYDDYYIMHSNYYSGYELVLYKTDKLLYNHLSLYFYSYSVNGNRYIANELDLIFNDYDNSIAEYYYVSDISDTNVKLGSSLNSIYVNGNQKSSLGARMGRNENYEIWVDTSLPVYLMNNIVTSTSETSVTYTLNIEQSDGNILTYETNKMIIDAFGKLVGNKPTISARHSNVGNETYLSIEFSIFDTSRYKYEYSLYDTNAWTEISDNNFLTKIYEDGTVFVRITDRQTSEFVTSYSYLMTNVIKQVPKIEFYTRGDTTGTGYLFSFWVDTHFTIFNREKYKYEYSINSYDNFVEILDNDYEEQTIIDNKLINIFGYRFVNNGYIIVRIQDRQTGEYITSRTYNVAHFEDVLADVIFTEQKYCGKFHQGTHYESEDWNICTRLHFKILYYDTSRYDIFYKISENGQWIRTYDETTSIDLYENTRVYVRIYDKTNSSTFERYYDVNSIDPPEVVNAPYVEGIFRFDEETNTMLLRLVFINYNPSLYDYKYMIGTSKRENLKLMDDIVKDEDDLYYNKSFSFTYETYIIVEIDDKDGNYIKAYTFQIEFDDYVDNSMTGFIGRINSFFDNFKNTLEYVSNLITMFFNTMPSFIQMILVVLFIMFLIFVVLKIGGWRQ